MIVQSHDRIPLHPKSHHNIITLNTKIGRLEIKSEPFRRRGFAYIYYECQCECGEIITIQAKRLTAVKNTQSCGCLLRETRIKNGSISKGRQLRKHIRTCSVCSQAEDSVKFPSRGKLCFVCHRNRINTNRQKRYPTYKLQERLRLEATPEKFLATLLGAIDNRCNSLWHKQYDIDVDITYIMELWKNQNGLCAISQLPMVHRRYSLYTVSIDRISPDLGYIRGNVQLVCKCMNLAKQNHSNDEMKEFMNHYRLAAERNLIIQHRHDE